MIWWHLQSCINSRVDRPLLDWSHESVPGGASDSRGDMDRALDTHVNPNKTYVVNVTVSLERSRRDGEANRWRQNKELKRRGKEREREREREKGRGTEREKRRETNRERKRSREKKREREREAEGHIETERDTPRHTERNRKKDIETKS